MNSFGKLQSYEQREIKRGKALGFKVLSYKYDLFAMTFRQSLNASPSSSPEGDYMLSAFRSRQRNQEAIRQLKIGERKAN